MAAADFYGLDSEAFDGNAGDGHAQLSSFVLQRMHESAQYILDERVCGAQVTYSQHYYDSGGGTNETPRPPTWYSANTVCRGPFLLWVPSHVREVTLHLRGAAADSLDVFVAAFSATHYRNVTRDMIARWHNAGESWTGTVTSVSTTTKLSGIPVTPGRLNAMWIAVESEQATANGLVESGYWVPSKQHVHINNSAEDETYSTAGMVDAKYLKIVSDANKPGPPVLDNAEVYTVAHRYFENTVGAGDPPKWWQVAEHDLEADITGLPSSTEADGHFVYGDLGALEVQSLHWSMVEAPADYVKDRRLRWFKLPGVAVRELYSRISELHRMRHPIYAIGQDQRTLTKNYPGTWRPLLRSTVSSWTDVSSSIFRFGLDKRVNDSPYLVVSVPVCWAGRYALNGFDQFRLVLYNISGSSVASAVSEQITPTVLAPDSWLNRWVIRTQEIYDLKDLSQNDEGAAWGLDGMTPPEDLSQWRIVEFVLQPSSGVEAATALYRATLQVQSSSINTTGVVCVGDWALRLQPHRE